MSDETTVPEQTPADDAKAAAVTALLAQAKAELGAAKFWQVFKQWILKDSSAIIEQIGSYLSAEQIASYALQPRRPEVVEPMKVEFAEVEIPPRDFLPVSAVPETLFRGQLIEATDSEGGSATGILFLFVGQKPQRPVDASAPQGTPTMFFSANAAGNQLPMDTCYGNLPITFWVRNNTDKPVKWKATIHGLGVKGETSTPPPPSYIAVGAEAEDQPSLPQPPSGDVTP